MSKLTDKQIRARKKKAEAKAAKRRQYEEYKRLGINAKSKRSQLRARRAVRLVKDHKHEVANCGNVGCQRCFTRPKNNLFVSAFPRP